MPNIFWLLESYTKASNLDFEIHLIKQLTGLTVEILCLCYIRSQAELKNLPLKVYLQKNLSLLFTVRNHFDPDTWHLQIFQNTFSLVRLLELLLAFF